MSHPDYDCLFVEFSEELSGEDIVHHSDEICEQLYADKKLGGFNGRIK